MGFPERKIITNLCFVFHETAGSNPVSAGRHPGGPDRADGQRLLHRGPGPRAVPGRLLPVPA